MFCPVDGTGRRPSAGRHRSLPGSTFEPARARKPSVHVSVQLCFVSKYNSEPSHAPRPSRCILLSCVIRPHAHPWSRTPAGQALRRRLFAGALPDAPTHPACCSHLLAPCAVSLFCAAASVIASSRLSCGMLVMASSHHPSSLPRCLSGPHSGTRIPCPPSGLHPPTLRAYSQGFMRSNGPALCCRTRASPCPASILQ